MHIVWNHLKTQSWKNIGLFQEKRKWRILGIRTGRMKWKVWLVVRSKTLSLSVGHEKSIFVLKKSENIMWRKISLKTGKGNSLLSDSDISHLCPPPFVFPLKFLSGSDTIHPSPQFISCFWLEIDFFRTTRMPGMHKWCRQHRTNDSSRHNLHSPTPPFTVHHNSIQNVEKMGVFSVFFVLCSTFVRSRPSLIVFCASLLLLPPPDVSWSWWIPRNSYSFSNVFCLIMPINHPHRKLFRVGSWSPGLVREVSIIPTPRNICRLLFSRRS